MTEREGHFFSFPIVFMCAAGPRDVPWVPAHFRDADGDCWRNCNPTLSSFGGGLVFLTLLRRARFPRGSNLELMLKSQKCFQVSLCSCEAVQSFTLLAVGLCEVEGTEV